MRIAVILYVCCAVFGLSGTGLATTRADIYQVQTPITDRSEAAQGAAFQSAMRTVLVRVTGRRAAEEEAAFAPLLSNARRYVQQYRASADGQIWVSFDGPAIERWLTQNGQTLWGRERPTTFVLVAAQTGSQTGVVLSANDTSELKGAIDAAAEYRGLPLQWPTVSDLQRNHLDYATVAGGTTGALAEISRRAGAEGILIGRASGTGANASVRWTHFFQDRSSEYTGTVDGVNRAADVYASLFSASGNLASVDIEVSGVKDLREYASVQTYLESLTSITHVGVVSLTGETVRFRLATRGGADSLARAVTFNGKLQPLGGENGIQRFQLRR